MRRAESGSPPAIIFRDLEIAYGSEIAISGLTGEIPPGSLTAVIGPNGAGKSTLLKGIAGLVRPHRGEVAFSGGATPPIGYLPQHTTIDRDFPILVRDLVGFGLWQRRRLFDRGARRDAVATAIATVGLSGLEEKSLGSLSGGQLQRALVARLLLQGAPILLLDEPFAWVDHATEAVILGLIARWQHEGRTVVAALHDIDHVRDHFPQTLLIDRTPIAWGATGDVLAAHPQSAAQPAALRPRLAAA